MPARASSYLAGAGSAMRPSVTVHAVPCFADNYSWQVRNAAHRTVVLVDPAEAAAALLTLLVLAPPPFFVGTKLKGC